MNKTDLEKWVIGNKFRNQLSKVAEVTYSDASLLLEIYTREPVTASHLNLSKYRQKGINRLTEKELIIREHRKFRITPKGLICIQTTAENLPKYLKRLGLT